MTDDPRWRLTKWLTEIGKVKSRNDRDEKTRIMTKEQYDYLHFYRFLADDEGLGIKMFDQLANISETLMISWQGKAREEIVEGMKAMSENMRRAIGLQPNRIFDDEEDDE